MSNLLEITGNDIAKLNDADLRTLIGLLCEADYRFAGLSTVGVTWSGHQDAPDGGFDVVVRSTDNPPKTSFIPRKATGFQVKKPDLQPAKIGSEMKPKGVLRSEIMGLIIEAGAYIIVSSSGSTTDSALKSRIKAMQTAVEQEPGRENIHLDFFDRGRIATWVRSHPSLILWVRNKIGRQLKGWHPYENWAQAPDGIKEEYITDKGLRLHDGTESKDKGLSVDDGIVKLRSILSTSGTSVRLAGLSGVGKTRFAQALFDERIGRQALNRTQAFYTDISDGPEPDPKTFSEQLIADKTRAVLIVDNCPPDLHHKLTQICVAAGSTVSLLTVEYDVRDDLPEETSVFRLEPASEEIIIKLIAKRFPHISQVDLKTIAEFSGGNARIAIVLANTVKQGETLSGFRNEQLFERIFRQRNDGNEALLQSAGVLSLVYSFEGTDTISDDSEIQFLASLINKTATELHADISELKARGLIQSRGRWRAVLPHAIANRLAKRALEKIPKDTLLNHLLSKGSERIIKSFSRRLSYLHDSKIAAEIASDWLKEDGWLGKEKGNFNSFGIAVFRNLAAVSPEKTLEAIDSFANDPESGESFASRENPYFNEFVRLLRQIAYDPKLFEKCIAIIIRFALTEKEKENYNSIKDVLKSLFYIYLSGTHASVEQRVKVIEGLVTSTNIDSQELGLLLLDAALETSHFTSGHEFDFGARSRDYGYMPETHEDIQSWYKPFIDICTHLVLSAQPISAKAKLLLANNLRGLWSKAGMFDAIEKLVNELLKQGSWSEGWISIRSIIQYDRKKLKKPYRDRLRNLEKLLKPTGLLERARTYALTEQHYIYELEDDYDDEKTDFSEQLKKIDALTHDIGVQVAKDKEVLGALLPEIASTHNSRSHTFGRGLTNGASNKLELWGTLKAQLEKTPRENRRLGLLQGFLFECAQKEPATYEAILDELMEDNILGDLFPLFQTSAPINKRALERLHRALDKGQAPLSAYNNIGYGRAHELTTDDDLAALLKKMLSKEGGAYAVVEILVMRFHNPQESRQYSESLLAVARETLLAYPFEEESRNHGHEDYSLAEIAEECLKGAEGANSAKELNHRLVVGIGNSRIYTYRYPLLFSMLAKLQPRSFLDEFLEENNISNSRRRRIFSSNFDRKDNPLNQISDSVLMEWCNLKPESRYKLVVDSIQPYTKDREGNLVWKPVIYTILENAPDLDGVLEALTHNLHPTSWSGSLADKLQKRSGLFQSLYNHPNTKISGWSKNAHLVLQEQIKRQREFEDNRDRERNESFE